MPLFENQYPESQLRMVIDKVLLIAAEQGIGEAPVERSEPEEDEAMSALQNGDIDGAISAFQRLVSRKPNDAMAKSGLAQMQLLKRTQGMQSDQVLAKAEREPMNLEIQIQCADLEIANAVMQTWSNREDRYSEIRHLHTKDLERKQRKVEMSYIGG